MITRNDLVSTANSYLKQYIDFIHSHTGQDLMVANGFIRLLPEWDVNYVPDCNLVGGTVNGGACNLLDLAQVRLTYWNDTGISGWIPADINNDGSVNILDLAAVRLTNWNNTWEWPSYP